jgi:hypothetical protein
MKCAIEFGSGNLIYIPSFTKICLEIQKLLGGIHIHTSRHRRQGDIISLILFLQIKVSRLKMSSPKLLLFVILSFESKRNLSEI